MALDAITAALDIGGKLISRLWPDPTQAAAAQLELLKLAQSGELAHLAAETDLAKAQIAVNEVEARAPDFFTRGWRPAVGWVCVSGLAVSFLVGPLATWLSALIGHPVEFPKLDMATLMTLLAGLLGFGGMRMTERLAGKS